MKPTKNTIYCLGCQRSKMLFETKVKADNFIKYNSEGILEENGKAPVRSYYCEFCCGYHVTSNPSIISGDKLSDRDHKVMEKVVFSKKESEKFDKFNTIIRKKLTKAQQDIYFGHFELIEELYNEFQIDIDVLRSLPLKKRTKYMLLKNDIETLFNVSIQLKEMLIKEEKYEMLLKTEKPTKTQEILIEAMTIIPIVRQIENGQLQITSLLKEGKIEEANAVLDRMKIHMSDNSKISSNAYKYCVKRINESENKIAKRRNELKKHNIDSTPIDDDKNTIYSDSYKSSVLAVIDRIEKIKNAFIDGDIDSCENHYEIACYMLDDLKDDENKRLIESQLEIWRDKLQ